MGVPNLGFGSEQNRLVVVGVLVMLATVAAGFIGFRFVNSQMGHHMGGAGYTALVMASAAGTGTMLVLEAVTLYFMRNLVRFKNRLTRQAQASCDVLGRCMHGDLTARMEENTGIDQMDTLAGDFNDMMNQMEALVSAAKEFSNEVAAASQSTASEIQQAEHATEGVSQVTQAVSDDIEARLQESLEQMERLSEDAEQISQVAEFVGDVARQTNMLGVNARIEASKSETENQGFKTVAGQVKELADETHAATDDIQELLDRLQREVNETLQDIEETGQTVESGTDTIQSALLALRQDGTQPADIEGIQRLDPESLPGTLNGDSAEMVFSDASIPKVRQSAEELAHRARQLEQALDIFDISENVDYGVIDIPDGPTGSGQQVLDR